MKLKNKLFGKIFSFGTLLLAAAAVLQCCSCGNTNSKNSSDSAGVDTTVEPLPATFVSDSAGLARGAYFKAHKDSILHCNNFYFDSVGKLQSLLQGLLQNGKGSITGLRIYIAETKDSNIALIFSPTVKTAKGDYTDSGQYQILTQDAGSPVPIDSATAEQYVINYKGDKNHKGDKKPKLDKTITVDTYGETTSLLYDSAQINDMCEEMRYQNSHDKDAISGIWIIVTAHTDKDTLYPQRLNLEVSFAGRDANHSPISIEKINPGDYKKRQNVPPHYIPPFHSQMVTGAATSTTSGGMDTAIPCPTECDATSL